MCTTHDTTATVALACAQRTPISLVVMPATSVPRPSASLSFQIKKRPFPRQTEICKLAKDRTPHVPFVILPSPPPCSGSSCGLLSSLVVSFFMSWLFFFFFFLVWSSPVISSLSLSLSPSLSLSCCPGNSGKATAGGFGSCVVVPSRDKDRTCWESGERRTEYGAHHSATVKTGRLCLVCSGQLRSSLFVPCCQLPAGRQV